MEAPDGGAKRAVLRSDSLFKPLWTSIDTGEGTMVEWPSPRGKKGRRVEVGETARTVWKGSKAAVPVYVCSACFVVQ